jgi:hypothetical protein
VKEGVFDAVQPPDLLAAFEHELEALAELIHVLDDTKALEITPKLIQILLDVAGEIPVRPKQILPLERLCFLYEPMTLPFIQRLTQTYLDAIRKTLTNTLDQIMRPTATEPPSLDSSRQCFRFCKVLDQIVAKVPNDESIRVAFLTMLRQVWVGFSDTLLACLGKEASLETTGFIMAAFATVQTAILQNLLTKDLNSLALSEIQAFQGTEPLRRASTRWLSKSSTLLISKLDLVLACDDTSESDQLLNDSFGIYKQILMEKLPKDLLSASCHHPIASVSLAQGGLHAFYSFLICLTYLRHRRQLAHADSHMQHFFEVTHQLSARFPAGHQALFERERRIFESIVLASGSESEAAQQFTSSCALLILTMFLGSDLPSMREKNSPKNHDISTFLRNVSDSKSERDDNSAIYWEETIGLKYTSWVTSVSVEECNEFMKKLLNLSKNQLTHGLVIDKSLIYSS